MRKAIHFHPGIAYPILICLLVFVASCTKEYSLDITVQPANSGSVNLSPSGDPYEEGTEVILSPVPNSGYKFASWSGSDASAVNNDRIVMSKDMIITANFDLQHMIRLKTGVGLNPGAEIYFVALSKNNYFDLTTDEKFNYDKNQADWYVDGGVIPFTTDYKEFDLDIGDYYFMLRASGLVMITTITVISGKQTIEIYATQFGGISVDISESTKSSLRKEENPRRTITIRR